MSRAIRRRDHLSVRLELGTRVRGSNGDTVGELADVVIDPAARRVTHLVVRAHHHGQARLVPIEDAEPNGAKGAVSLRCTPDEFGALPAVDDVSFVRLDDAALDDPKWDVGVTDVLALPYYDSTGMFEPAMFEQNLGVTFDRIPKGEVELRSGSSILTSDGKYVGGVAGLVVDDDEDITGFVLERGFLWRRRAVTIPADTVAKVQTDSVTLSLSEEELASLPSRRVHRWFVF